MVEMRFNTAGPLTLITLSMSDIQPRRILLFDQKIILKERHIQGFPGGTSGKEPACQCRRHKRRGFDPWVGKISQRRGWKPTPVFLPGKSHGWRSLTLWDPMDCSLPRSSVHGIFQARVLEWVAISFSRESSRPRDRTWISLIVGRHFTV